MKLFRRLFIFFFISVSFVNMAGAQDTSSATVPTANAIAFYNEYIGESSHLYNGSEYTPYDFRIKGHPYFETNLLQKGMVKYDEVLYPQIEIAYDIVRDELTTNRYNENFRIKLASEKIGYFSYLNHYFVRLVQDSLNKSILSTGFYDRLYDGKTKLFAKRQKKIKEAISAEEGDKLWFEESDAYYIEKDNKFYSIKDQNELFDFFKDRKKDLKKYLRKNKIKFKNDPEEAITKSVEYYDQLMN